MWLLPTTVSLALGCGHAFEPATSEPFSVPDQNENADANDGTPTSCRQNSDCPPAFSCVDATDNASATGGPSFERSLLGAPLCNPTSANVGPTSCAINQYCLARWSTCGSYCDCIAPCPNESECPPEWRCNTDGPCLPIRCDDPEFPGCGPGMVCNSSYTWNSGSGSPAGGRSAVGTTLNLERDTLGLSLVELRALAGCVVLPCDAENGVACAEDYQCAVTTDQPDTATGCVPTPCQELGRCQSEDYLCTPTRSLNSALEGMRTKDIYGCTRKNCEDPGGPECNANEVCVPERAVHGPNFDRGCAPAMCAVGEATCGEGEICEPMNTMANVYGCVLVASETTKDAAPGAACSVDSNCAAGFCTNGHCAANLGQCTPSR